MPTFGYSLSTESITDVSSVVRVTVTPAGGSATLLDLTVSAGGTLVFSTTVDVTGLQYGESTTESVTGLSQSTTYTVELKDNGAAEANSITFTTKATGYDTPKTATQEQWEDLATRVKSKADSSSVPVITMSATDPGEGSPLAANNYIAVYGTPLEFDYSTSEVNTGTKWVDGSFVYKKTVNTGALPDNTTNDIPHNISNLDKVIRIEGYAYRSSDGKFIPLPFPGLVVSNTTVDISIISGNIRIANSSNMSAFGESYITLYYTKSV